MIFKKHVLFSIELYDDGKKVDIPTPYLLEQKNFDIDISIVVPAYNEEQRLPTMMTETLEVRKIKFISFKINNQIVISTFKKRLKREDYSNRLRSS